MSQPMVCDKQRGGCGYVAFLSDFKFNGDDRACPMCRQDHAIMLTSKSMSGAVDNIYLEKARMLLDISMGY
jgi:hypothetical protein